MPTELDFSFSLGEFLDRGGNLREDPVASGSFDFELESFMSEREYNVMAVTAE